MANAAAPKADTKTKELSTKQPIELSEVGPDALVLQNDMGVVRVSEDVVAKIAGLAVREVDGVHELVPFGASQTFSRLADAVVGTDRRDMGVRVEVGKVEAAVDVRIVTDYGVSIPKVAAAIRKNVKTRIETMTGLELKEINIDVLDLFFAEASKGAEPSVAPKEPRVR